MSTTTHHTDRDQIFDQAAEVARHGKGAAAPPGDELVPLLTAYYRHVSTEELDDRSDVDVYGAYASHHHLAAERQPETTKVRVYTPTVAEHGWSAGGHSVVEVVTDDMSFLVDSLTMELARQHRNAHLVLHPTLDVERDDAGRLVNLYPVSTGSATPPSGALRESWMHVEIDRLADDGGEAERLADDVRRVLGDVRAAVDDWSAMQEQARTIVAELEENPPPLPEAEVSEGKALLEWLAEEHFTFLGYREYKLERIQSKSGDGASDNGDDVLRPVPDSGLGILRGGSAPDHKSSSFSRLSGAVKAKAREKSLLVLAKANSRATVHRPAYLDYVGVKVFGADGEVVGERRFLGLFSSAAYTESVLRVPLLRVKVAEVLEATGLDPRSHDGNALLDTLETYPRDELFHTPTEELAPIAEAAMQARERRAVRMFIRRDIYARYLSVLIYLPRDRYNTSVRQKFVRILAQVIGEGRIDPDSIEFNVSISASTTARVHFVVRMPVGETVPDDIDTGDLERRLIDASRSWHDDFLHAVTAEYGEEVGAILARRYVDAFPEAYKEDFPARTAAVDLGRLEAIHGDAGIDQALYSELDAPEGEARLKLFRVGPPLSLSEVLPMLSSMGVEVVDERPYGLAGLDRVSHIYDFGLRYGAPLPDQARELFSDALRAIWDGYTETDGFNRLVLRASLTWRQAMLLRAYAKYMRQGNSPFAIDSIEGALADNVDLARMLVTFFETRFDPDLEERTRDQRQEELGAKIKAALDDVVSLDHDRILRSYLTHIRATLRTNYFQRAGEGKRPKNYLSLKMEPSAIPDLPEPRPKYEIFVYSPRVEGVHLRFGAVARGGLRWSDRRDDFRTEILGLVKAQMVKNTVIVPVGAKGGFYAKQLPDPAGEGGRDAWLAEGVECYKTFIRGLLDVTDNLVGGENVPPERVVRRDGNDSYLVVAADKGTATFSDIANGVSKEYGFWLGDAFASGGSVGYDHKAMGITARGAWVSVRRHFRELGIDCQNEDITVAGIGDMSGDVFGNGMLCSEHIRLVAAFDHRDIFIDPEPDAATSYAERRRLFELPRSSWQDYDKSLISEGGGVFPRSAKSIPINHQIRSALGILRHVDAMTPAELMKAILLAPVDLLWNGGIGTYVKATVETNADAGDKANDAIRVNGTELRARVVGEGGNLGCTQRGRIEFAHNGGRINTDFIDNSAGVDTSDREVNLKILLDRVVVDGDLTEKQRNKLLASMTDEVADLVLRDNYEQNLALANAARNAPSLLHVHEQWMKQLESENRLDRDLEALPSKAEVKRRLEQGGALTQPELSVLMAYTKIVLAEELLGSDLPEDPYCVLDLVSYFPQAVREGFGTQIEQHPLRREIIVTQVVNDLVNGAGMTYWPRLTGETAASAAELTRANFVAREIFGSLPLREELATYDNKIDAAVQTRMRVDMRTLVERASRWLITNRRPPLDSQATVDLFAEPVQATMLALPELLVGRELEAYDARRSALVGQGVPEDLAARVASYDVAYALLNVVDIAERDGLNPQDVARVHFALGDRLGISVLQQRIVDLPRADQWQTMARAALRDDLHAVHAQLTAQVLATTSADEEVAQRDAPEELRDEAVRRVAEWESATGDVADRAVETLGTICADDDTDLARVSVALRVVRGLLA
ncbi:NAD-glutamate dehydrogenase [Nocardioides bizhenqiangii]|uniref:NAD-glutamate dehydrogenase n=1 Tax=Nocardioides bizhenqiangii TaxID=3095076 RepID=A0ABZ0ZU77_9ACTN|nr:NAD-glutamate dehydrogenase [Nocardioides sp. HM61]WQQ27868.1 NAD-glutamate dehydrogenase [Nocardioides sp. HM61]